MYADRTEVSVEKSRMEIEQLLRKNGAEQYASGWDAERAVISCRVKGLVLRFAIPMPLRAAHARDRNGYARTESQVAAAVTQAERQKWRAMLLVIKAKFESIDSGVETFEEAFLANVVLPTGETMGDWSMRELPKVYTSGVTLSLGSGS